MRYNTSSTNSTSNCNSNKTSPPKKNVSTGSPSQKFTKTSITEKPPINRVINHCSSLFFHLLLTIPIVRIWKSLKSIITLAHIMECAQVYASEGKQPGPHFMMGKRSCQLCSFPSVSAHEAQKALDECQLLSKSTRTKRKCMQKSTIITGSRGIPVSTPTPTCPRTTRWNRHSAPAIKYELIIWSLRAHR